jgi:hypothetical protein
LPLHCPFIAPSLPLHCPFIAPSLPLDSPFIATVLRLRPPAATLPTAAAQLCRGAQLPATAQGKPYRGPASTSTGGSHRLADQHVFPADSHARSYKTVVIQLVITAMSHACHITSHMTATSVLPGVLSVVTWTLSSTAVLGTMLYLLMRQRRG